jgi:SnoaL-like domain
MVAGQFELSHRRHRQALIRLRTIGADVPSFGIQEPDFPSTGLTEETDMTTAASRTRLEDRAEIIDLGSRYAFLVDRFDLEGVLDLWVDDEPVLDETPLGLKKSVGKEQLRQCLQDDVFGMVSGMLHMTGNHLVEQITDTTARGYCAVSFLADVKNGGGTMQATAWYDDQYERVEGIWKFRSRIVTPFTKPQFDNYFR